MVLSLHNNGSLGICLETDERDTMQVFLTEDCCIEEGGRKSLVKYICRLLSRVHVQYHLRLAQLMERLELLTEDQLMNMAQTALDAKSIDELKLN
jgi:hypothetical protein